MKPIIEILKLRNKHWNVYINNFNKVKLNLKDLMQAYFISSIFAKWQTKCFKSDNFPN